MWIKPLSAILEGHHCPFLYHAPQLDEGIEPCNLLHTTLKGIDKDIFYLISFLGHLKGCRKVL